MDVRGLMQLCNVEWFKKLQYPRVSHNHANILVGKLSDVHRSAHHQIAKLLDQLSPGARQCLMAGLKIQVVADVWDAAVQERNYAYLI